MFAPRNHQSTGKTAQGSDSNQYQESPVPPTVEDIAGDYYEEVLPQQLAFALAHGVVKHEPIEQEDYWEEEGEFEGVEEHGSVYTSIYFM